MVDRLDRIKYTSKWQCFADFIYNFCLNYFICFVFLSYFHRQRRHRQRQFEADSGPYLVVDCPLPNWAFEIPA